MIDFHQFTMDFIGVLPTGYGYEIIYPIITMFFILFAFFLVISPVYLLFFLMKGRR